MPEFLLLGGFVGMVVLAAWAFVSLSATVEQRDDYLVLLERVLNEVDPASLQGDLYGAIEEALGL